MTLHRGHHCTRQQDRREEIELQPPAPILDLGIDEPSRRRTSGVGDENIYATETLEGRIDEGTDFVFFCYVSGSREDLDTRVFLDGRLDGNEIIRRASTKNEVHALGGESLGNSATESSTGASN